MRRTIHAHVCVTNHRALPPTLATQWGRPIGTQRHSDACRRHRWSGAVVEDDGCALRCVLRLRRKT
eukprot:1462791-Prymnesium_polylepis.1